MSLSQLFRTLTTSGRRHACMAWKKNWTLTPVCECKGKADYGMWHQRLVRCMTNRRPFSSDSKNAPFSNETDKMKNDPEIRAWMTQIAQDFESGKGPFEDLVGQTDSSDSSNSQSKLLDRENKSSEHSASEETEAYVEVEDFGYMEEEEEYVDVVPEQVVPVSLERGQQGVFEVEEVVSLLEAENGVDIQVLDVPPQARFVDHMVLVTGKSLRHMRAMAATMEWVYKRKKASHDKHFKLEGRDCRDWLAMDLGNMVVHIFTPEARQHYDLETLWTLGPEHDDPRHYVQDDSLNLSAADLFWLETSTVDASSTHASDVTNDISSVQKEEVPEKTVEQTGKFS